MRKNTLIINTTILICSIPFLGLLGVICGYDIFWKMAGDLDSRAQWRRLPPPPAPLKQIIAANYFTVYATTTDGKILGCYRESRLDVHCWFEVNQLPEMAPDWQHDGYFESPPSGIHVVQTYQIDYPAGRDDRSAFSYVIDEDGQVWQWGYEMFMYFGPPAAISLSLKAYLVGGCSGVGLPLILIMIMWLVKLLDKIKKTHRLHLKG
jgi:hypothetical protein